MADQAIDDPQKIMDRLAEGLKECEATHRAWLNKLTPLPSGIDWKKDVLLEIMETRARFGESILETAKACREEKLTRASLALLRQHTDMEEKLNETRKAFKEAVKVGDDNACAAIELNDALAVAKREPFSLDRELVEQRKFCFERNGGKGYLR